MWRLIIHSKWQKKMNKICYSVVQKGKLLQTNFTQNIFGSLETKFRAQFPHTWRRLWRWFISMNPWKYSCSSYRSIYPCWWCRIFWSTREHCSSIRLLKQWRLLSETIEDVQQLLPPADDPALPWLLSLPYLLFTYPELDWPRLRLSYVVP